MKQRTGGGVQRRVLFWLVAALVVALFGGSRLFVHYAHAPPDSFSPVMLTVDAIQNNEEPTMHVSSVGGSSLAVPQEDSFPRATPAVTQEDAVLGELRNSTFIRKWGCHRNETPTIFVHIPKAGGGQVRVRFAAAALNFTRDVGEWRESEDDHHYYPLPNGARAKFCNSMFHNYRYDASIKSYEGTLPCNGSTPLGMALACPSGYDQLRTCPGCEPSGTSCHSVYVGHNLMGSELHWLPAKYLQKWWNESGRQLLTVDGNQDPPSSLTRLDEAFDALVPHAGHFWCPWDNLHRPSTAANFKNVHDNCGARLAAELDAAFHVHYHHSADYSPFYASLPVQRVVLIRDPWSWLISRLFWIPSKWTDSDGAEHLIQCDSLSHLPLWVNGLLQNYVIYLCGVDCQQRIDRGLMTMEQAETQAANNLRLSFSVVGLLNETQTFFDMVSARIAYVDMSLNLHLKPSTHTSKHSAKSFNCDKLYRTEEFRQVFRQHVPLMEVAERLYQIAVEVNQFQQQELKECTGIQTFGGAVLVGGAAGSATRSRGQQEPTTITERTGGMHWEKVFQT